MHANYYLAHHGIRGQEWGRRNGPPYPLDASDHSASEKKADWRKSLKSQKKANDRASKGIRDVKYQQAHTIPAGTKIYRTSANPDESSDGLKYISYIDADRNHYKGGWIRQTAGADKVYEYEFTATDDIKVPSRDELYSVINDTFKSDPKLAKETVNNWLDMVVPKNSWERAERIYDRIDDEEIINGKKMTNKQAWEAIVNESVKNFKDMTPYQAAFYSAQSLGTNNKLKDKVIKELSSRGYNAMVDEASVGGQNGWGKEGIDPLILFDGNLLKKENVKQISSYEEQAARREDTIWQQKTRKNKNASWSDSYSEELYTKPLTFQNARK